MKNIQHCIYSCSVSVVAAALLALGATNGAVAQGQGGGQGNSYQSIAEPVDLEPGDVEIQTSDPTAANFEEEFTYYVVRGLPEYEAALYREPARLGGQNVDLAGSNAGAFWFGVSGPDGDGIQHNIDHKGQVTLYLLVNSETDDWQSVRVQFDGRGNLLHANGVAPE